MRRGKVAAKGATVIFWRLAGGDEEELLALRVLLLNFVAIFFEEAKIIEEDFVAGPHPKVSTNLLDESRYPVPVQVQRNKMCTTNEDRVLEGKYQGTEK